MTLTFIGMGKKYTDFGLTRRSNPKYIQHSSELKHFIRNKNSTDHALRPFNTYPLPVLLAVVDRFAASEPASASKIGNLIKWRKLLNIY